MRAARPGESALVALICEAIRKRVLLEFLYHDHRRVVAPYCCGASHRGSDVLRAVQVRGGSRSGGLASGKLWTIADIVDLRLLDEAFTPNDPDYNPQDSAMTTIYCRI